MLNANILRTMVVGVVVVGAAGCGSSIGGRSDGGTRGARTDAARDRSGTADRPQTADAAGKDGKIDVRRDGGTMSGRGTGQGGDPCTSSADCACGFYCLGDYGPGFCTGSGLAGDPCLEACDCPSNGYVCHPNNGNPVCQPPDAGLCVPRSGCDDTHPCCGPWGDLCCVYPSGDRFTVGVCSDLC